MSRKYVLFHLDISSVVYNQNENAVQTETKKFKYVNPIPGSD